MKTSARIAFGVLGCLTMVATEGSAAGPPLQSNTQKYRDSALPHATGRSGNAVLSASLLLSPDGSTALKLVTGTITSPDSAQGTITKAQVKVLDDAGNALSVKNHNGLNAGGVLSLSLKGLSRGQRVQVQANVRGIDKRNDVVTVSGTVKKLPDPKVVRLDSETKPTIGTPVNITATITESNADLGVRGDCILWVDGAAVDRATGVYVASGGTVSCAFSHTFDSVGSHTVRVSFDNTSLPDWDSTNNVFTLNVDAVAPPPVEPPAPPSLPVTLSASVTAQETTWTSYASSRYRFSTPTSDGKTETFDERSTLYRTFSQTTAVLAFAPYRMPFPLAAVKFSEASEGTSIEMVKANLAPEYEWGDQNYGASFGQWWDGQTSSYFYVSAGTPGTWVSYVRRAGEVVYFSRTYQSQWYNVPVGTGDAQWTWNVSTSTSREQSGVPTSVGASYSAAMRIEDGKGDLVAASVTFPIPVVENSYPSALLCTTYTWDSATEERCTSGDAVSRWMYGAGGVSIP